MKCKLDIFTGFQMQSCASLSYSKLSWTCAADRERTKSDFLLIFALSSSF